MSYQNNIPQATDQLSISQNDILNNFASIGSWAAINHIGFDATGAGKHSFIQFPTVQGSDIATAAGEVALYTKTGVTNVPALFFRGQSNATVGSGGFTEYGSGATGWTRLPSGILIKWGYTSNTLPNPSTIVFPTGATIPAFTTLYSVQITQNGSLSTDNNWFAVPIVSSFSATQFQVWSTERTSSTNKAAQFLYLAIGI